MCERASFVRGNIGGLKICIFAGRRRRRRSSATSAIGGSAALATSISAAGAKPSALNRVITAVEAARNCQSLSPCRRPATVTARVSFSKVLKRTVYYYNYPGISIRESSRRLEKRTEGLL